jgi:crotonobetainyl-CoA:carnitine CoA-transferase CaiB-like acyl-CoA transferase
LALAIKADVVLDNYRPGVMKRLGIDYETVSKTNPGVIYLSISGTGPTGPYVKRPAYDTVGQGLGGMLSLLMDAKNPRPIGPNYADSLSGMFACIGVLGAIAARAKTGKGQQVDTTMAGSILAFLIAPATDSLATGKIPGPYTRPMQSQTYAFTGSDGAMFAIHLSSPQKFWEGLCKAAGHPELVDDARFSTRPNRRKNYNELARVLPSSSRKNREPIGWSGSKPRTCRTRRSTTCRKFSKIRRSNIWVWRSPSNARTNRTSEPSPSRTNTAIQESASAAHRSRRTQREYPAARPQRSTARGV